MSARRASLRCTLPVLLFAAMAFAPDSQARTEQYWDYYYSRQAYDELEKAEAAMREANGAAGEHLELSDTSMSTDSRTVYYRYAIEPQPMQDIETLGYYLKVGGFWFWCGNQYSGGCPSVAAATQEAYDYLENLPRCKIEYELPSPFQFNYITWDAARSDHRRAYNIWYSAEMKWWFASYFYHNPDLACGTQHRHHSFINRESLGFCPPGLYALDTDDVPPPFVCTSGVDDTITARLRQVCHDTEGNPCSPATGNKTVAETDFEAPRLSFRRFYNSAGQFPNKTGLGPGWSHNYSARVLNRNWSPDNPVHFVDSRGHYERFEPVGDKIWRSVNKRNLTIRKTDSGWELRTPAGSVSTFDNAGRLREISNLDSPVSRLTLSYTEAGRISSVESDTGRTLDFVYGGDRLDHIELPGGSYLGFSHDEAGNLTSVRYPDDSLRVYLYENATYPHALTGILDELGNRFASYAYDKRGRVISSEHAGGANRVELQYQSDGDTLVRRASGAQVTYSFGDDPFTSTRGIDYADGRERRQHDSDGRILSRTDKDGTTTTFQYDDKLLKAIIDAKGTSAERTVQFTWNTSVGRKSSERLAGRETTFEYDVDGRLVGQEISAQDDPTVPARETTWGYRAIASGVVRRVTTDGPRLNVADTTTYEYYDHDAPDGSYHKGDLHRRVNTQGQVTEYLAYDPFGRPTAILDPNGTLTTLTYNARGWLTSRTLESASGNRSAVTRLAYDATGNLIRLTRPNGSIISYKYDDAHRLVAIEDALGNRVEHTLDASGNRVRTQVLGPGGSTFQQTVREFDELNRALRQVNGVGDATQHDYAPDGKRISTTEPDGDETRFSHDALHRLTRRLDALGGETNYAYDDYGNLIQVVDPRGVTTEYDYDPLGNLLAEHSPDAGTTTYQYDAAGNRIIETDARGVTAEFTYDSLDRPTRIEYPESGETLQFSYDEGPNGSGSLTSFSDPTGTTEYDYNFLGKITADRRTVNGIRLIAQYRYDSAGNRLEMTYPSGNRIRFERDTDGRISGVYLVSDGADQAIAKDIQHAPFGPVSQLEWGDGSTLTRRFDAAGRLIEQQTDGFQHLTWEFAPDGNITRLNNLVEPEKNQVFGYDSLNRLTHAEGAYGVLDYQYDAVGNRTQLTDDGSATDYSYALDSNRLLQAGTESHAYDAAGNTTQMGDLSLTYNARGRLSQAEPSKGQGATYSYNALGQRVIKIIKNKTRYFMYDLDGHLIGEYDDRGDVIREYVYLNDRPIALLRSKGNKTEVLYIHTDHLGTPKLMTNEKGQVRWEATIMPFGETDAMGKGVELPLRFPSQYADDESGLHYNYFRDYEPGSGRYIQSDPIGLRGGLNLFEYGEENPLTIIDPFGLAPWNKNDLVCLSPMDCYCEISFFGCNNDEWERGSQALLTCANQCVVDLLADQPLGWIAEEAIEEIVDVATSRALGGASLAVDLANFYDCMREQCGVDDCE